MRSAKRENPCAQHVSATTETKEEAGRRLIVVSGGLFIASVLGIVGVLSSMPLLTVTGSMILFLESIAAIFNLAPFTFVAAILLLLAARQTSLAKRKISVFSK